VEVEGELLIEYKVLEEWILIRVHKNLEIPPIDKIEIKIKKQYKDPK